jgi:hypothetical protein
VSPGLENSRIFDLGDPFPRCHSDAQRGICFLTFVLSFVVVVRLSGTTPRHQEACHHDLS